MSPSIDAPLRLGIVGCGFIADFHGAAARHTEGRVRFAACADPRIEVARRWAADNGATPYAGLREMLASETLDGVLLATWPTQHAEHLVEIFDAGLRYVLCEKPLAATGAQALSIWREARSRGVTVLEAFIFRHHPIMRLLKDTVASGRIGKVDTLHATFQVYDPETAPLDDASRNWRQVQQVGGGAPLDLTCYCVHACGHLAESLPADVTFVQDTGRYGTIVRMHGMIRYENGIVATIHSSRRAAFSKAVSVHGELGSLHVPVAYGIAIPGDTTIRLRSGSKALALDEVALRPDGPWPLDPHIGQQRQLAHFADVIRGTATPLIPLVESVVNMHVIDAMLASAGSGRTTRVNLPADVRDAWTTR